MNKKVEKIEQPSVAEESDQAFNTVINMSSRSATLHDQSHSVSADFKGKLGRILQKIKSIRVPGAEGQKIINFYYPIEDLLEQCNKEKSKLELDILQLELARMINSFLITNKFKNKDLIIFREFLKESFDKLPYYIRKIINELGQHNLLKSPTFEEIITNLTDKTVKEEVEEGKFVKKLIKVSSLREIEYSIHSKGDKKYIVNYNNLIGYGQHAIVYQAIECNKIGNRVSLSKIAAKIFEKNSQDDCINITAYENHLKDGVLFKREAEIASHYYRAELIETNDKIINFMGMIEGEELQNADIPSDFNVSIDLALELARFINLLHNPDKGIKQAILHGDIKFSNFKVYRDADGIYHIRLYDFGESIKLSDLIKQAGGSEQFDANTLVPYKLAGTPQHLAPERLINESAIGIKSETYALLPVFLKIFGVGDPIAEQNSKTANVRIGYGLNEELLKLSFNTTGLLDNFCNIPNIKVDGKQIDIGLIVKSFLQRMGNKTDHTMRPDDHELLLFFNTFKQLLTLNKNSSAQPVISDHENQQAVYLAKLHLLAAGDWQNKHNFNFEKIDFTQNPDLCKKIISFYQIKLADNEKTDFRNALEIIKQQLDKLLKDKTLNYSQTKKFYPVIQKLLINARTANPQEKTLQESKELLTDAISKFLDKEENIINQVRENTKQKRGFNFFFKSSKPGSSAF